jgi:3'(2'), 5'-bisphosphate nucleotidase
VTKFPFGLDINNLIGDLRFLSWEAGDILIYYSNLIRNPEEKANFFKKTLGGSCNSL